MYKAVGSAWIPGQPRVNAYFDRWCGLRVCGHKQMGNP